MGQIRLSAFADEYASSLLEQLEGLARFGIDHLELRYVNGKNISVLAEGELAELRNRLLDTGIRVSAIGSPLGKIRLDEDLTHHLETARRIFEAANLLDTPFVRVFSFYAPAERPITDCREEVFAAMDRLLELAARFGVTLCHENEARIYGDTPARCRELLDAFAGRLGCVFDMGNFVLEGVEPYAAYELLKKDISYFHIKDALFNGAIVPPGCGDARIREILSAHTAYAKEDFFVSLEPHLETFSGRNALVGRAFENPYKYPDAKAAFADAVAKLQELI